MFRAIHNIASLDLCEIPAVAGIYLFTKSKIKLGLAFDTEPLYLGRSKNLRKRLAEHLNGPASHNPRLQYQFSNKTKDEQINVHYVAMPEKDLDVVEKEAIKTINPTFNIIHNGGNK